jgi:hypothetical protein
MGSGRGHLASNLGEQSLMQKTISFIVTIVLVGVLLLPIVGLVLSI